MPSSLSDQEVTVPPVLEAPDSPRAPDLSDLPRLAALPVDRIWWCECAACTEGSRLPLEATVPGAEQSCDLCSRFKRLLFNLRRVPRNSRLFEHAVDTIESLSRLAESSQEDNPSVEPSETDALEPLELETQVPLVQLPRCTALSP